MRDPCMPSSMHKVDEKASQAHNCHRCRAHLQRNPVLCRTWPFFFVELQELFVLRKFIHGTFGMFIVWPFFASLLQSIRVIGNSFAALSANQFRACVVELMDRLPSRAVLPTFHSAFCHLHLVA